MRNSLIGQDGSMQVGSGIFHDVASRQGMSACVVPIEHA
jgi:hypothetical protein